MTVELERLFKRIQLFNKYNDKQIVTCEHVLHMYIIITIVDNSKANYDKEIE